MIATKTHLFVALVAAAVVSAQSTTDSATVPSTTGVPPCILDCVTTAAASAGCSSLYVFSPSHQTVELLTLEYSADLNCVCTSDAFQTAAGACLTANCTADEVGQALALQAAQCGGGTSILYPCNPV
jgi:alkylhydroperoxidase/carboxymuconolactone decarboxylase family protein YurZ